MEQGASLESLFQAYFDCRKNKRNTMNALRFEMDYEGNLAAIREELNSSAWHPGRSIAFVIDKPVKREIFAADFRDRVVHHWLINQLNPRASGDCTCGAIYPQMLLKLPKRLLCAKTRYHEFFHPY